MIKEIGSSPVSHFIDRDTKIQRVSQGKVDWPLSWSQQRGPWRSGTILALWLSGSILPSTTGVVASPACMHARTQAHTQARTMTAHSVSHLYPNTWWCSSSVPVTPSVKHEGFNQTTPLRQLKMRLPGTQESLEEMFGPCSVSLLCSASKQVSRPKAKFFGWAIPVVLASSPPLPESWAP